MSTRGWFREEWRSWEVPARRYRGLEDFPLRPIAVDYLPEQPSRVGRDEKDAAEFRLRYGGPQSTPRILNQSQPPDPTKP